MKVLYTGTLMNGRKFDSTHDRGDEPAEFKLAEGGVIQGWVDGVKGMRVGGKRKLAIPSAMGYGAAGHPPDIPGDAGLKFDVELVAFTESLVSMLQSTSVERTDLMPGKQR